jgi:hypothetical protein
MRRWFASIPPSVQLVIAVVVGFLLLPIALRIYTLWWDLIWGAGYVIEILVPPRGLL